jgi:excisionase family DNA binding protein
VNDNISNSNEVQNIMVGDEILTVSEVAVELRCSKAHVYNAIAGKVGGVHPLPAISMGRRKLVRRGALEQWKRANEGTTGSAKMAPGQQSTPFDA